MIELVTGFVTKGQSLLGCKFFGVRVQPAYRLLEREVSSARICIACQDCEIQVWVVDGIRYIQVRGELENVGKWVSSLVWVLPDLSILLRANSGAVKTTVRVANAILAVQLVPGGCNLAPMLMDQAVDGEFR